MSVVNLACFVLTFRLKLLFKFFLCILSLYIIYDWITIMRYSKHELSTISMATSPQWPLSSVPKVAVVERFDPWGGGLRI